MTTHSAPLKLGVSIHTFDESASVDGCLRWLRGELNREPEPIDLYTVGKQLYQSGQFLGAAKMLSLYMSGNGSEMPGSHLLGYAYYMCEEKRKAVQQLKRCVNSE